jgi:Flp pilus assembly protein TadD
MSEPNPIELSTLVALAISLARQDEFGVRAIEANERIIELSPGDLNARNRLARCHLVAGDLDAARGVYMATLAIAPEDKIARNGMREIDQLRSDAARDRRSMAEGVPAAVGRAVMQARSSRLVRALHGLATDPADMVDALLHVEHQLREGDRDWIRVMDETAAGFRSFAGFTPRQAEVIRDIYRRYLAAGTRR